MPEITVASFKARLSERGFTSALSSFASTESERELYTEGLLEEAKGWVKGQCQLFKKPEVFNESDNNIQLAVLNYAIYLVYARNEDEETPEDKYRTAKQYISFALQSQEVTDEDYEAEEEISADFYNPDIKNQYKGFGL